ncbi:MAG: helix-turn-helix transcriptional regulator [Aeromonas sp.]
MGRTTFVIVPERLKGMRIESGLTQQMLMSRAYKILGRSPAATSKTLIGHYQRIEKNGHTSKALADALAKVLETTVEVLQGKDTPEPYHYIDKLVKQLKVQLDLGNNQALNNEFSEWQRRYNSQCLDVSEDIHSFARELGIQIELAQLIGQADELVKLREITGWSNEQILNPANVHGHWFIRKIVMDSMNTSLEYGLGEIMWEVRDVINKVGHFYTDDMHVSIKHAYPWIHIDLLHPRINDFHKTSFIFSRTLPKPDGLKWVLPSEADKRMLCELERIAFDEANFVTLNDRVLYPSDVRNLRLKIVEITDHTKNGVAYSEGWLTDQEDAAFNSFLASGKSHYWVVNRLTGALAEGLRTHLHQLPEVSWKVDTFNRTIHLTCDTWKMSTEQRRRLGSFNLNYIITLVELMPDGSYRSAPWAKKCIDETVKSFKHQLQWAWMSDVSSYDDEKIKLHFEEITKLEETVSDSTLFI